ncbi:ABC transporter ATP-binding protein [Rhizobium paknamense]|uniref:Iron(III) transport system ATP-binding protein n=1 Tax=Rhizobium paknamense TaxID=1206817 RepID=A0ABU0IDP5_9HYPH|nr:ABC transporter ATP-binding protein [Rhizobium paknamense]MDQ0456373.1 iron(III) transport system ATP-binding protein [Rhizobium paknamense]
MTELKIEAVSKHYGPVRALEDINLTVASASRTAIVGPSGSGKTTLLRILAGFETADQGRVMLGETGMVAPGFSCPAHLRGIGIVAQDGALFPHLSIAENIGFGIERRDPRRQQRIEELAAMVELDPAMLKRRPHQLSGGQQQRVALARALAREPRLMLLDEPFSALDTGLRETMRKAVSAVLAKAGITTILVTHDQAEALSFADQLAVLREGRLVQAGPPRTLYEQPCDADTAILLGEAVMLNASLQGGFADCALGRLTLHSARQGAGRVMLRPEQIRIASSTETSSCTARVLDVEFAGATGSVTVALNSDEAIPPLHLRLSRLDLPNPGDVMHLAVEGKVHALA